jgi:hypothetical protein
MARTTLNYQSPVLTGVIPTYTPAIVDGHAFLSTGSTFIHVKNGSGVSVNVTIPTPMKYGGLDVADVVVAVAAGAEKLIGPFNPSMFNQIDGLVHVDYSVTASITIAIINVGG